MQSRLQNLFGLFTILFCCAVFTIGAPGDLDLTFDGTGKVTTDVGAGADAVQGIAVQTDGKIVATGLCSNGTNNDFCLVRYNADGSLDNSFDGDGKVLTPLGTRIDNSRRLAIQPDGKIVVVGSYQFNPATLDYIGVIARYNSNGSLDTTFSGTGFRFVIMEFTTAVAIQPDGKILAAGYTTTTGNAIVQRVNANGSDDATFGNNGSSGYAEIVFGTGRTGNFASVALQADGKIVAAGSSSAGSPSATVVRLTSAGLRDTTFGTNGQVITAVANSQASSVLVQPDGKILATGSIMFRFNTDGSPDTSFDGDGTAITPIGSLSTSLQPNGKIVVCNASGGDFAIARFNANGSLDTTFSSDGSTTIDFGATGETGYAVALDSSGRMIVGGVSNNLFAMARVLGDTATASGVSISGRAITGEGRGLTGALVTLTDTKGISRSVVTTRRGTFYFEDIEAGATYIISVASRRFSFEPKVVQAFDNLTDIDFIAADGGSKVFFDRSPQTFELVSESCTTVMSRK